MKNKKVEKEKSPFFEKKDDSVFMEINTYVLPQSYVENEKFEDHKSFNLFESFQKTDIQIENNVEY
jgi:hypothetical protein